MRSQRFAPVAASLAAAFFLTAQAQTPVVPPGGANQEVHVTKPEVNYQAGASPLATSRCTRAPTRRRRR